MHGKLEIILTGSLKKVTYMLSIILGMIFLALIIYGRERMSGFKNDTCPGCKRKFTLKIIYPDPNNGEEVKQAKVMRKRCEACGHIINIPCDFEKDGRIGQALYQYTGKVSKIFNKW